jgi:hypothetical protein
MKDSERRNDAMPTITSIKPSEFKHILRSLPGFPAAKLIPGPNRPIGRFVARAHACQAAAVWLKAPRVPSGLTPGISRKLVRAAFRPRIQVRPANDWIEIVGARLAKPAGSAPERQEDL